MLTTPVVARQQPSPIQDDERRWYKNKDKYKRAQPRQDAHDQSCELYARQYGEREHRTSGRNDREKGLGHESRLL